MAKISAVLQALMHAHEGVRMAVPFSEGQRQLHSHEVVDGHCAAAELSKLHSQVQHQNSDIQALQANVQAAMAELENDLNALSNTAAQAEASGSFSPKQTDSAAHASHVQALLEEVPGILTTMQTALTTVSSWCQPSPVPRKGSLVPDPSRESA